MRVWRGQQGTTSEQPLHKAATSSTYADYSLRRNKMDPVTRAMAVAVVVVFGVTGCGSRPTGRPAVAPVVSNKTGPVIADAGIDRGGQIDATDGRHLFRSADKGRTWSQVPVALPGGSSAGGLETVGGLGGSAFAVSTPGRSTRVFIANGVSSGWLRGEISAEGEEPSLSFADRLHGVAIIPRAGSANSVPSSAVFATVDGGRTWTSRGAGPALSLVRMSSATQGWAVGGSTTDRLSRTSDGGRSWTTVTLPASLVSGVRTLGRPYLFGASIVVPGTLFLGKESVAVFYTSIDAGRSWSVTRPLHWAAFDQYGAGVPLPWDAISPSTWVIVTASAVLTTSDAGRSWTHRGLRVPMPGVKKVSFTPAGDGVAEFSSTDCRGPKGAPSSCVLHHGLVYLSSLGREERSINPPA